MAVETRGQRCQNIYPDTTLFNIDERCSRTKHRHAHVLGQDNKPSHASVEQRKQTDDSLDQVDQATVHSIKDRLDQNP